MLLRNEAAGGFASALLLRSADLLHRSGVSDHIRMQPEPPYTAAMTEPHYRMSFSTGGLFLNESVALARLHDEGQNWNDAIARGVEGRASNLPKTASNRRTLREIANRLSCLTEEERQFLTDEAERPEKEALLWLATCRAYPFVREFAIEVVREKLLSYRHDLPLEAFDQFFEAKAEWHQGLADISLTTRRKLRQVLFRMMREAGIIDAVNTIRPAYLSSRLHSLIANRDPNDLLVFPGL